MGGCRSCHRFRWTTLHGLDHSRHDGHGTARTSNRRTGSQVTHCKYFATHTRRAIYQESSALRVVIIHDQDDSWPANRKATG